jgi:hypothetical protein
MPKPHNNIQFIESNIYGSPYTIQPDIPAWINTTTSFAEGIARQIDLVTYENDLFLTKQLLKRIHKEVFRISGEVIRENFKQTLTQNWFWTSHEELIKLLKRYKTIPDNTVTQASLLQNVQNIPFRGEQ